MFCINCGTQNDDDSLFCMKCGAKLSNQQNQAPKSNPQPIKQESIPNQPQQNNVQQPINNPVQPTQVTAPQQEGCLSAAFHDITSSRGWFKKIFFMALCNIIPFMSFGTIGYSQQWAADVAKGKRETLPNKIFFNRNFITGLLEYITWAAHGFVYILCAIIAIMLVFWIPILGWLLILAILVFAWFWNGYVSLASMKAALDNELGESFNVKKISGLFKKKFGSVFCAYFVPSIICGVITVIIAAIFIAIYIGITAGTVAGMTNSFNSAANSGNPFLMLDTLSSTLSQIQNLFSVGGIMLVIFIILIAILNAFMGAFEKLLRYRAIGHIIAMYAPEWTNEEKDEINLL